MHVVVLYLVFVVVLGSMFAGPAFCATVISRQKLIIMSAVNETCYMSMVKPILEYASLVWSPSTEHNISKLEMVQRRAARFVLNDFPRYSSVSRF